MDVNIKNIGTRLITSVYRKEAAQSYVVPFQSDHQRHVFVNIIECALLRALRYSSTLKEFNDERRTIKMMLLYNGFVRLILFRLFINIIVFLSCVFSSYPPRYIYNQFKKFFTKYSITSTSIIPMIHDENEFLLLRRQLLDQASVHEHRRATRLAQMFDYDNFPSNIDSLVKTKLLKRKERANSVILHYTYEKTFSTLWTNNSSNLG